MRIKQSEAVAAVEAVVGKAINACLWAGGYLVLAQTAAGRKLAGVTKDEVLGAPWKVEKVQEANGLRVAVMELNANNGALVRRYLRWTAPDACGSRGLSLGVNDGLDNSSILPLFKNRRMKPVLADATPEVLEKLQKNFLNLTDVCTWAVLAADYRNGYGATAAGLATEEEIVKALLYGYSSVGFDASGKIVKENVLADDGALEKKFEAFPMEFQAAVNASYLNAEFKVGKHSIVFTPEEVRRIVLEYGEVIMHVQYIYNTYLKSTPWPIDFELKVQPEGRPLTTKEHYLIANELERNGVKLTSFLFDLEQGISNEDLAVHGEIANSFEYRLSLANADNCTNDLKSFLKVTKDRAHFKVSTLAGAEKVLGSI